MWLIINDIHYMWQTLLLVLVTTCDNLPCELTVLGYKKNMMIIPMYNLQQKQNLSLEKYYYSFNAYM